MPDRDGGLTAAQHELVNLLPASTEVLVEELGIGKEGVSSRVDRARNNGATIRYSRSDGVYFIPGQESEFDVESVEGQLSRPDGLVDALRNEGLTAEEAAQRFDLTQRSFHRLRQRMRDEGYTLSFEEIDEDGTRVFYIPDESSQAFEIGEGDGIYRFALIGDTHLGSEAEHLQELHDFYDRIHDRGIEMVFHAGDITDGWEVHRGHINVIQPEAAGWGRLKDYTIENYPQREGVHTFFIEGNHDHKYFKANGIHIGDLIDNERPDLHYCGDSSATFVFDSENGLDLELLHPSGGKPYCYTGDTRVLTKRYGFVRLDEMPSLIATGVNLEMATFNTDTGELEYEEPEKFTMMPWSGDMVQFSGQSLDFRVTPNHKMVVRKNRHHHGRTHDWGLKRADEMEAEYTRQKWDIPVNGGWSGEDAGVFRLEADHPNGNTFEAESEDFLRFLGWFVSEGWTKDPGRIQFSQKEKGDIVTDIEQTGLSVNIREDKIKTTNKVLSNWLDKNVGKGATEKRVPDWVKRQSPERIEMFLSTLFEGDGHSRDGSFKGYTTASRRLADDVVECLLKTGRAGTVNRRDREYEDFGGYDGRSTTYEISVSDTTHRELTQAPSRIPFEGYVYCPTVENGTVVTMRNGKVAISGNTAGYRAQTVYRERSVENRPTIGGIGHIHGKAFLDVEDVQAFYVGCWKGQTTYGKRRGNQTRIGGWIVEIEIEDGELRRIVPEWIGYQSSDASVRYSESDISDFLNE